MAIEAGAKALRNADRMSRPRLFAVVAVTFAAIAFGTPASAAGLLEPIPRAESEAVVTQASPQTVRRQLVRIDAGYMEATVAPRGADKTPDRLEMAPEAGAVRLELFPEVSLTVDRNSLKKASGGGYIWSGSIRGGDGGYAVLVIKNGRVTAQIQTGSKLYRIAPVAGDIHGVDELDPGAFPPDTAVSPPAPPDQGMTVPELTNPEALTRVRVLFPYTKAAQQQSGGIAADIDLAVSLMNLAARNGGARVRYKLAGKLKVRRYSEGSFSEDLAAVSAGKGKFRSTRKKRNAAKADIVVLLRSSGSFCGLGWYIENPNASTADYGFNVTAINCISNHSVAHETGHNSGLEHDRYQLVTYEGQPEPPNTKYNFGYTNLKADVRSVMAYNAECGDKQPDRSCPRVPMFSSSKKKYEGAKLGQRRGRKGAADASRRLNETRAGVASYR
ncbi:M12 family metallo-peptidase [Microbaculum marinum]|uniref:M12 family metallo-peptidase n=1 Tax=Microbaculum marinum TaxID=1764581 RepID=A0AAW9RT85_9HYPH